MKAYTLEQTNEEKPFDMMQKLAFLDSFVQAAKEDVHINFKGANYISPAVALLILALRDELKKKKHTLYFAQRELIENPAVRDFFTQSGLKDAIDQKSQAILKPIWEKTKHKSTGRQYFAHVIDLNDLSHQEEHVANSTLVSEAFKAVDAIGSTDDDFCNMLISKLVELLNNTLAHSCGDKAYTMAALANDGGCIIAVYDRGIGIPGAYGSFAKKCGLPSKKDSETIRWAMQKGTSTLQAVGAVPRGAGLFTMKELADKCNGRITIASMKGMYLYQNRKEFAVDTPIMLPGTMFIMKIPAGFRL